MAQAAVPTTDELLSQLAASEIDRLLAEADGNPAPTPDMKPPPAAEETPAKKAPAPKKEPASAVMKGDERAALLEAAGFDKPADAPEPPATEAAAPAPPAAGPEIEDERSALLKAAGFETPGNPAGTAAELELPESDLEVAGEPLYLKPLIWLNAPLESCPVIVKQILGKVGIVTLINALAVLTYVIIFRKHP